MPLAVISTPEGDTLPLRHLTIKTRYPRFHLTRVMMSFRRVDVTPGFEPEMTESKSVVLPLHHITMLQLLDLISELPTVSTND